MTDLKQDILLRYLQGDRSAGIVEQIARWVEASPQNSKELFSLELAYGLPDRKRMEEDKQATEQAEQELVERILSAHQGQVAGRRRQIWSRVAGYAAVAAVLGVAVVFGPRWSGMQGRTAMVEFTAADSVRQILLPDGTKVWLNSQSTLSYPAGFSAQHRSANISGEAYFEVVHDSLSPFTVTSPAMRVTVLGTVFNIRDHIGDTVHAASLIEGKIKIAGNNGEGNITLTPGQKAEIDCARGEMRVVTANVRLEAVWRNKMIPFNDASLYDIVDVLESLYKVDFVLSPRIDAGKHYSGTIRRKDSIRDVLQSLQNSIPIKYRIEKDQVYIEPSNR